MGFSVFRTINTPINKFADNLGKTIVKLNKIASNELKSDSVVFNFSKATPEDLKRLTSKSMKDTYKRVTWTNPEDGKVYHILKEGRTKEGINVKILDRDGAFVKNATLQPKKIVVFDQFRSLRGKLTHGELVETFVKRFNPFADVERLHHKQNVIEMVRYRGVLPQKLQTKKMQKLYEKMQEGKQVDYISISETAMADIGNFANMHPGECQKQFLAAGVENVEDYKPLIRTYRKMMDKGAKIFMAAGNSKEKGAINSFLAIDGIEGVGALEHNGKVAMDSASKNSSFTRSYEKRSYYPQLVKDNNGKILGLNITGRPGAELPYNYKTNGLKNKIGGTSYATPVRVAKLSLNDMMQGVL